MTKLLRFTATGLALGCVLAAGALASPALVVTTSHLVRGVGPATIATREDSGTYRTTVYAPTAYRLPNIQHIDKSFGTASITVATARGALRFSGSIVGSPPAVWASDTCAATAGENHLAVWLLELRQADGRARTEIPVYVDAGPGARTVLTWCASSASGMTVTSVALHFDRAFFNPVVAGSYRWQARFDNVNSAARSVAGVGPTTSATATVKVRSAKKR